jgi:LemA protein
LYGQLAETRSRLLNAMNAPPQGDGAAKTTEQKRMVIDAGNGFGRTLRRLDSLLESYPQLRSNEKFVKVQEELAGVGNRIAVARSDYNSAVQDYLTTRKEPRMSGVAERYGFTEEPYFKSERGQPVEPKVNSVRPVSMYLSRASRNKITRN